MSFVTPSEGFFLNNSRLLSGGFRGGFLFPARPRPPSEAKLPFLSGGLRGGSDVAIDAEKDMTINELLRLLLVIPLVLPLLLRLELRSRSPSEAKLPFLSGGL